MLLFYLYLGNIAAQKTLPRLSRTDQQKRCWRFTASCNFFSQISFGIACKNWNYYIPLLPICKSYCSQSCSQRKHINTYLYTKIHGVFSVFSFKLFGITSENTYGAKRTRTADPLHAMQVLYQLSYGPKTWNVNHINKSKDIIRNVLNSYSTLWRLIIKICT